MIYRLLDGWCGCPIYIALPRLRWTARLRYHAALCRLPVPTRWLVGCVRGYPAFTILFTVTFILHLYICDCPCNLLVALVTLFSGAPLHAFFHGCSPLLVGNFTSTLFTRNLHYAVVDWILQPPFYGIYHTTRFVTLRYRPVTRYGCCPDGVDLFPFPVVTTLDTRIPTPHPVAFGYRPDFTRSHLPVGYR